MSFALKDVALTAAGDYDRISLAGAITPIFGAEPGTPALPLKAIRFLLPDDVTIAHARVVAGDAVIVPGSCLPLPLRPLSAAGADVSEPPSPLPAIYDSAVPFPASLVARTRVGWMRGLAVGTVLVNPMQYVGAGGELRLYRNLQVEIDLAPLPAATASGIRRRSGQRAAFSPRGHEIDWLRGHVVNPADLERFYGHHPAVAGVHSESPIPFAGFVPTEFPSTDGPPVHYVIVTDSVTVSGRPVGDLVAEFQRLADWKTAKGTPAVVRTVSWVREHFPGHDDAARIRAFLIDAYELWGTDYALLGGDLRVVPARRLTGVNLGTGHPPADAYFGGLDNEWDVDRDGWYGEYYSDVEESDPYWDVWVGRAPVDNQVDAATFVDKCLIYARAPGADLTGLDPAHYTRMLLMNGLGNCSVWGHTCNGIYVGEAILRRLAPPTVDVTRVYQQLYDPAPYCTYHETYVEVADSAQVAWTAAAAMEALNTGVGFVHHFEHSNPYAEGGASGGFGCAASTGGALGREYIDMLTNRPNWPIVVSTGAGVNAFDYESVSEHWMINPDGGAVAYIGKTRSGSIGSITGEVDTLAFGHMFQDDVNVGQAMAFAVQATGYYHIAAVTSFDLLGDPELQPWTAPPATLELQVVPSSIVLGDQLIEVVARDEQTQAPVPGTRVALAQGNRNYAFGLTDADGSVKFAVTIGAPDDCVFTATAINYLPAVTERLVQLGDAPQISYLEHSASDDSSGVANANGIADAGEVLQLDVTVENVGLGVATQTAASLQAIGAVELALTVDGVPRPDLIFCGATDGHAPAGTQLLSFPEFEFRGLLPVGRPTAYLQTSTSGLFVWRDGPDWHLIARGEPGPFAPPIRFAGVLRVPGGHADADAGALEPGDGWTNTSRDSLTFSFEATANGDQDSLYFSAREHLWLTLPVATGTFGDLIAGATASQRFIVALDNEIPDRHAPRLELTVRDALDTLIGRSSFSLPVAAPRLAYARQAVTIETGIPMLDGTIAPVLVNRGSGVADDVRAVLRQVAGDGSVVDSTVVFGAVAGGTEATAGDDQFIFATADTQLVRFRIELENRYPDGSARSWELSPVDVIRPCAPTGLAVEPIQQRGARLMWTQPASACSPDLAGYDIFRHLPGENEFEFVAATDSTMSFTDIGLPANSSWIFTVAARDSSGNLSAWSNTQSLSTWVADHPGWPRKLDAGTASSPIAIDIDGDGVQEIFALGNALYGWRADGSPIIPEHPDGTIFRPYRPRELMVQGASGAFFGSPAAADLDGDGSIELVMAAWDDSLWVVRPTGELLWGRFCVPKFSSPCLGDIDGDGDLEIVIGSDMPVIFAWHHDGTPVIPGNPDGKLADLPDGAIINYSTPALADIDGFDGALEVIYATFRGNVYAWGGDGVLRWSCDVGPDWPLSTPALGDINNDGEPELAVAQGNVSIGSAVNALYLIDAAIGEMTADWSGGSEIPGDLFSNGNMIHAPSLADLDGDGDLEILLGTSGSRVEPPYSGRIGAATVLVFEHDEVAGFSRACTDSIPEPGLNMVNSSGQAVNAQPVIADLDGDGILEAAAGSTTFGLFMFDLPPDTGECSPRPGWPMLFAGEVDATPVLGDIDGDGVFDMVVRSHDGEIHLFDLGSTYRSDWLHWSQFAHDPRHTSNYEIPLAIGIGDAMPVAPGFNLRQNVPNPFNTPTRIGFDLGTRASVRLRIYSVDGRLVRTLVDQIVAPGPHEVGWDGRDARGHEVPAGVYFYRLETAGQAQARKLLRIR